MKTTNRKSAQALYLAFCHAPSALPEMDDQEMYRPHIVVIERDGTPLGCMPGGPGYMQARDAYHSYALPAPMFERVRLLDDAETIERTGSSGAVAWEIIHGDRTILVTADSSRSTYSGQWG